MPINIYDRRDKPKLTATFTDAAGAVADPDGGVVMEVKAPDGTIVSYGYNLNSQGNWDAETNTPTLVNGTGIAGDYYTVTDAGSVDFGYGSKAFAVGDYVYYNGDEWQPLRSPSATTITKNSTGVYSVLCYKYQSGTWQYRAEGLGTEQCADENYLNVLTSEF